MLVSVLNQAKEIKVSAYTGGLNVPSARLRVRQYIPLLRGYGISVREHPLLFGKTMPRNWFLRPFWAASTVIQRSWNLPCSYAADVTLISRHVMPAFIPYDRWMKQPRVLDVDDAIWLNRGGHRAKSLAQHCDSIICGNTFLAEYFSQWNRRISIIPTAVDTNAMYPSLSDQSTPPVIGWTGTSDNFRYLYMIEPALSAVLQKHREVTLRVISDIRPRFREIDSQRVQFIRWSDMSERQALQTLTVGIMPLEDSMWARGKCSFKMLNYMAAGIPVVVSPVGMNVDVLSLGQIGFGATTADDWIGTLDLLLTDRDRALRMGSVGRDVAVRNFSVDILAPRLARELFLVAGSQPLQPEPV